MKIDIIVVYVPRYKYGHEKNFVPPMTGIHLAALTPSEHEVRVIHQQVQPIDDETDADLIALSFFSGFAEEAYRLADRFRSRGKKVVAGGPHVTFSPNEALKHCDAVVIGEAESVWKNLLQDADRGRLNRVYRGTIRPLDGLPTPRYDLLPDSFFIPRVVQATRGCFFRCSFCTVPTINPGFRMRPVDDVIADIRYNRFPHWWQRKLVWFWDDNPTANRKYFKELLEKMTPLNKWWLTQASIDIVRDPELLDLMEASGCIGIFLGIESFGEKSLDDAQKRQNQVRTYEEAIRILHDRGINVMAGFIAGFDHDAYEEILQMVERMMEIGVDVPFISVLTPFKGTPLYDQLKKEGRLLKHRGWDCYNGYNVAFQPKNMSPDRLKEAHTELWKRAFAPRQSLRRALRSFRYMRLGALLMSLTMNGFYGLKALRGNTPADVKRQIVASHPTEMMRSDSATAGMSLETKRQNLPPRRFSPLPGPSD